MAGYYIYWKVSVDLPASPGPKVEDSGMIVTTPQWYRDSFNLNSQETRSRNLQDEIDADTPGRKVNFFLMRVKDKELYPYVSFKTSDGRVFTLDGPLILIGIGAMALLGRLFFTITNNSSTDTFIEVIVGVE